MKILTLISIRKNQSCYSNRDIDLYSFEDLRQVVKEYPSTVRSEKIEIHGEMYHLHRITVAPDWILKYWEEDTIKEKAESISQKYTVQPGVPDVYRDYLQKTILFNDIVREKERQDAGYVLTKQYPRIHSPKEYVGGFSLEAFFVETLISYVEKGLTFGYIGHSCRKVWVDKLLSAICLPTVKYEDFACWLTSTDGRHFGDAIEGWVEDNDIESVKQFLQESLPRIHDLAVIYNHPDHKGNHKSTQELFGKLKESGLMLSKRV